jgi:hypothetical protein
MENIGIFYGRLECTMAIGYITWPFGNLVVFWYIFPRFGTLNHEKSGNPGLVIITEAFQLKMDRLTIQPFLEPMHFFIFCLHFNFPFYFS